MGEVAAQRYARGEISYAEWAENDVKLWTGLRVSQLQAAVDKIPYQRGVKEVFTTLKEKGVRTAILSAGLSILADKIAKELGADMAVANELELDNEGVLTGKVRVKVAVGQKYPVIEEMAKGLSLPIDQVALVGDRADDLCIPECLRIAFRPVDAPARNADFVVESDDLSKILQILEEYVG